MTVKERIDLVEKLALERQGMKETLRLIDFRLGRAFDATCISTQEEARANAGFYMSNDLMDMHARQLAQENADYLKLQAESDRLKNEIAILDIKLERERSLVSLELWQRPELQEKPFSDTIM